MIKWLFFVSKLKSINILWKLTNSLIQRMATSMEDFEIDIKVIDRIIKKSVIN
jgi:hypothetical protein